MNDRGTPADTSTLIHLAKADALAIAHGVLGPLAVTPAVWREAIESGERKGAGDPARIRSAVEEGLLIRVELNDKQVRRAAGIARDYRVGRGESEVMALTAAGSRVLLDEGRGTLAAQALGLVPVSTLYIPLFGYWTSTLERAEALRLLRALASVTGARAVEVIRLEALLMETS